MYDSEILVTSDSVGFIPLVLKDLKVTKDQQSNKDSISIISSQMLSFTSNFGERIGLNELPFDIKVDVVRNWATKWSLPTVKAEVSNLKFSISNTQLEHIQKVIETQISTVKKIVEIMEVRNLTFESAGVFWLLYFQMLKLIFVFFFLFY